MSKNKKNDMSNSEIEGMDFITNQIKGSLKSLNETKSKIKSGDTSSIEKKKRTFEVNAKQVYIDTDILEEAPPEWNRFRPLSNSKYQILKDTIETQGLMHPIYVWEYNGKYIIISGHNRVRAYKDLFEKTKEQKYKEIPAQIEKVEDIDEERARVLVGIGNVQRAVSANEEFMVYDEFFKFNKNRLGITSAMENYEKIERETGKSLSTIRRVLALDRIINEIRDMIGGKNSISVSSAHKLTGFSENKQRWLYDEFKDQLNTKSVNKLSSDMTRDEIRNLFNNLSELKNIKKQRKSLYIPKEKEEKFDEFVKELIAEWEEENNIKWKF